MPVLTWILLPAVGALIGYVTNTIAVAMLFRPHSPRRLLVLTLHGLIPKRQPDLARKIGEVVGAHLLEHKDIHDGLSQFDIKGLVAELIDGAFEKKIAELQKIPMIGAFLTPERLSGVRDGLVEAVAENEDEIRARIEAAVEENVDIAGTVEAKVAAFPTERLERLVLDVARRELRAIEIWGAVLGALIGVIQAILLATTGSA